MRVLGVNAVFHDPAAALVVDGVTVAAAEEERFSRRKHGKTAVPFSTWEVPEQSAAWCLSAAGLGPEDLDAVAYSYEPSLLPAPSTAFGPRRPATAFGPRGPATAFGPRRPATASGPRRPATAFGPRGPATEADVTADDWEGLRTLYARRAPSFLQSALPGLDPGIVRFVPHHVAHAASAHLAAPFPSSAVLVLDGRGEVASHLAGLSTGGDLEVLAAQRLPHSLGLLYEEVTEHLGFRRSSDEYKVMALAAYGEPRFLPELRRSVRPTEDGGFQVDALDFGEFAKRRGRSDPVDDDHADLASSIQVRLEEVLLDLARWLHGRTGESRLTLAGGVALNCVANARLAAEGPFDELWVQPAAGDAGTALGAALHVAHALGDRVEAFPGADLGRSWTDDELEAWLTTADVVHERPVDLPGAVADVLAADGVVAWFQGRSEYGPRALGHRSLLADPRRPENLTRLNEVKGREQFRPVAPMVLLERAEEIFEGVLPSPYMLFVHRVRPEWRDRLAAVTHVDGTARAQTVDRGREPLVAALLDAFARRTGVPVLVNTSLNTAGRPMVDDPRDALECFGSAPVDALVLGPFLVRRRR